jgi:hypothetical protein
MSISDIAQGIIMMLSPYFQGCGKEIAKQAGKDIYKRIKSDLNGEKERQIIEKLESEFLSLENMNLLQGILSSKLLNDTTFYKKVTQMFNVSFSDTLILSLTLRSLSEINNELPRLYSSWVRASLEKKGEYQNRITELEDQLHYLEEKFFSVIQKQPPSVTNLLD